MATRKHRVPKAPLKWPGGKRYDAKWIIDHMPPHLHYVEPFFGSGAVFFARDPDRNWFEGHPKAAYQRNGHVFSRHSGCIELINDIHAELMNFFRVLQDEALFREFHRRVSLQPMSFPGWMEACECESNDPLERAVAFFIRYRQSRSGEGREFTGIVRDRTRGGKADPVNAYLGVVAGLPEAHRRLQRVFIECMDAKTLIVREDSKYPEWTLFYCDPPYPTDSRTTKELYDYEFDDQDHHELLDVLQECKSMVILSTYPNKLYDDRLGKWWYRDFAREKKSSNSREKKRHAMAVERIWMNFDPDQVAPRETSSERVPRTR